MADITINGITIDPLAPSTASIAAATLPAVTSAANALSDTTSSLPATDTKYALIQVTHPLTSNERNDLEMAGAKILEYVHESTYVCNYIPDDLGPIRRLPFVSWAGPYLRGLKIDASLIPVPNGRMTLLEAAAKPSMIMDRSLRRVDVIFHADVNADEAAQKIADAAGIDPTAVKPSGNKIRISVSSDRLGDLAALDVVRSIKPAPTYKLLNNISRQILNVDLTGAGSLPFEGAGQTVAVADTGFDRGSTALVHPAFIGRVVKLYDLGRPGKTNDPNGHGTHVAGSILGDGNSAILGVNVRGTAPQARLVLQSVLDAAGNLGGLPTDLHDLFKPPYDDDGCRIHSNSWGSTTGDSSYDPNASEVDDFVWNRRDCVICFAAGNEGIDADGDGVVDPKSITPPATAKNCITVGATENDRPGVTAFELSGAAEQQLTYGLFRDQFGNLKFPTNPLFSGKLANNANGMAAFSSRGPTTDMRFKPDVVAPGSFVLSTRSRDATDVGYGLANVSETLYMFDSGTSMATPLVAGCCALIREYVGKQKGMPTPSAALVKAMLINGAMAVSGQYSPTEVGPIPNSVDGFGRVNMDATIGSGAASVVVLQDEKTALDSNGQESFTVHVPAGAKHLKATLVWTDPAGENLQNDLDLIVTDGTHELHGNVPPGSSAFDRVNNVEQVVWTSPPAGAIRVTVTAFRIAIFPQSYALVVRVD